MTAARSRRSRRTRIRHHIAAPAQPRCYHVARAVETPRLTDDWDEGAWRQATVAKIDQLHLHSRSELPEAAAKLLYDDEALHLQFRVRERHVISRCTQRQGAVSRDSCVEFFVQPGEARNCGYFNFETNCGGTLFAHYQRASWTGHRPVADAWLDRIGIYHTMPRRISTAWSRPEPMTWRIGLRIPLALIEAYAGPLGPLRPARGVRSRANWYKCALLRRWVGHWSAWSAIGAWRNFHQPDRFGTLVFD